MLTLGIVLFEGFELLDVFGPVQMLGHFPDRLRIRLVAKDAGNVRSVMGHEIIADTGFNECPHLDAMMVPGGIGTRRAVNDRQILDFILARASSCRYVASVCTGAALLAKAGLLDNRCATTNKRAFDWVASQGVKTDWQSRARWVEDGRFLTSSGVSAGMDMALVLCERLLGAQAAADAALWSEYIPNLDSENDPFAREEP